MYFSYMANIISNHSISKMNMAAFEKETVVLENLCGNGSVYSFQKLFSTFFMSGHICITLAWRLLSIHISNRANKAFFKKIFP